MHLGVFGGTFNPPHVGHMVLAVWAVEQLNLDRLLLVPNRLPPHKQIEDDPGPPERLRMCELASDCLNKVEASDLETAFDGHSYTVDTLRRVQQRFRPDQISLIIGADQAEKFAGWKDPQTIIEMAQIAVAGRGEDTLESAASKLLIAVPNATVATIEIPRIDVSSSVIRDRVKQGLDVQPLLDERVAKLISASSYYR